MLESLQTNKPCCNSLRGSLCALLLTAAASGIIDYPEAVVTAFLHSDSCHTMSYTQKKSGATTTAVRFRTIESIVTSFEELVFSISDSCYAHNLLYEVRPTAIQGPPPGSSLPCYPRPSQTDARETSSILDSSHTKDHLLQFIFCVCNILRLDHRRPMLLLHQRLKFVLVSGVTFQTAFRCSMP